MTTSPFINPAHPTFIKELNMIGIGVLLTSFVYFIASNWFYLPHGLRMSIPMTLLFLFAVASTFKVSDTVRQTLHTLLVAMIGLSLAVIGQAYQTGADSFWLFGIWSVLTLPYLYRRNYGVFFIWAIISPLTLYLYFKQTYLGVDSFIYLILINTLLLINLYVAHRHYAMARFLLIGMIGVLSLFSVFLQMTDGHPAYIVSIFALSIFAIYLFKTHKDEIATAVMTSLLGLSLLFWFLFETFKFSSYSYLLFMGTLSLLWFCGIGFYLNHILPKGKFHVIPIGIGAYMAGMFYAMSFLTFWEISSLFFALITVIISLVILKKTRHHQTWSLLFVRHLGYALMLCGQMAFLYHVYDEIQMLPPLIIIQMLFALLAIWVRVHWLMMVGQLLAVHGLVCAYAYRDIADGNTLTLILLGIEFVMACSLLLLNFPKITALVPHRTIWGLMLCVIFFTLFYTHDVSHDIYQGLIGLYILQFVLIAILIRQFYKHHLNPLGLGLLTLLAAVLIGFGQFQLVLLLLGISYALNHQDKLINHTYLLGVVLLLWHGYFSLTATFLVKSMVMASSGVALIIFAKILTLSNIKNHTYFKGQS